MAVDFESDDPKALLADFDARIEQSASKGKITTWEKSADGKYYTHKAPEWNKKAWLKPRTSSKRLTFNIIKPKDQKITRVVYAYYHGHLIETFLAHFDDQFEAGTASALATSEDNC
jgi:hypothetical protein